MHISTRVTTPAQHGNSQNICTYIYARRHVYTMQKQNEQKAQQCFQNITCRSTVKQCEEWVPRRTSTRSFSGFRLKLLTKHMHFMLFHMPWCPPCPAHCRPWSYHSLTVCKGMTCNRFRALNRTRMCIHHHPHLYFLKPHPWIIHRTLASKDLSDPCSWNVLCVRAGIIDCNTDGEFGDQGSGQRCQSRTAGPMPWHIGTPFIHMSKQGSVSRRVSHQSAATPVVSHFIGMS